MFNRKVVFRNEHDYTNKLNKFQETLYDQVKEKLEQEKIKRTERLNEGREGELES